MRSLHSAYTFPETFTKEEATFGAEIANPLYVPPAS
jgi:hypothetical protein